MILILPGTQAVNMPHCNYPYPPFACNDEAEPDIHTQAERQYNLSYQPTKNQTSENGRTEVAPLPLICCDAVANPL